MIFENSGARIDSIGDVNGDGYVDFVLPGRENFGWHLNLFLGGPSVDTVRDAWFGLDTLNAHGYIIRGDDINLNGSDEIIAWEIVEQESLLLFELGVDSDSIPDLVIPCPNNSQQHYSFGEGLAGGDFNGDGARDFVTNWRAAFMAGMRGTLYMFWGGTGFDTLPDLVIPRPGPFFEGAERFGGILESLGDVNGDGEDDFYASSAGASYDTLGFVYFGGPDIDTLPDVVIARNHLKDRAAGDINHDGYNDLILSLGFWSSAIGWVEIYLGGLEMDSIADVRFDVRDEPSFHDYYGLDCSGVGDFNGDGLRILLRS